MSFNGMELYAEQWVPFEKELAVMVVRTKDGIVSYPVVETAQKDNGRHDKHTSDRQSQIFQTVLDTSKAT